MAKTPTIKVLFTKSREVKDGAGKVTDTFAAGKEYDLSPESAERWIRRGVAVVAPPAPAKTDDEKK